MPIIAKHATQTTGWQCNPMGAEEGKNGQCEASSNHLYQTSLPQPQSMPFDLQVLLLWMRICTARHATCERRDAFTHDQYMSVEGRSIIAVGQGTLFMTCNCIFADRACYSAKTPLACRLVPLCSMPGICVLHSDTSVCTKSSTEQDDNE